MKRHPLALGITLFALAGTSLYAQGPASQSPGRVRSRAEETLEWWNQIGNKLIAMAKDFPEDKYHFKVQKDQRTFAQNLVHVAAVDYDLIGRVAGSRMGPDFGKDKHNPPPDLYKTKADIVKLLESAVADGAAVIKQQGDAGLDQSMPFGWETGRHTVHVSYIWLSGIEHSRIQALAFLLQRLKEVIQMKPAQIVLLFVPFMLTAVATGGGASSSTLARPPQSPSPEQPPTLAAALERDITAVEKRIVDIAEAMPEDKFNFSPESLNIPGADYKGVRSFAVQVKHIAASNYFIWSPLIGEKLPEGLKDGNGPEVLKTKAEIMKFLKDSFALGHRAAATLTAENMLQTPEKSKSTRLRLATFGVAHAYNHYGQMVEYLRMNGIVPPASRTKSD